MNEEWQAARSYKGNEGVEKIFKRILERRNIEFKLGNALISLKAQNAIYTT
jgi:hypothetical protein